MAAARLAPAPALEPLGLVGQPTLALTGGADSVLASLAGAGSIEQFAVSEGGTLAALEAAARGRVAWSDRPGGEVAWSERLRAMPGFALPYDLIPSKDREMVLA